MRRSTSATLALSMTLALGLATGCSSSGSRPARTSVDEVAELKQRLVEYQRKATVGEVEMQRLKNELDAARRQLREAQAELARRQQSGKPLDDGIGAGRIGLSGQRVDEAELSEPEPVQRIETPPPAPVAAPAPTSPPRVAPPGAPSSTPPSSTPPPSAPTVAPGSTASSIVPAADPQALYDQAYTLFHQKSYQDAERLFGIFLERHGDSDLADNALFWVGESRFARGELQQALMAFLETVERYPAGNKVADALLKAGKCLESLGRKREAIDTYEEIRQRFPGSASALTADERLAALRTP